MSNLFKIENGNIMIGIEKCPAMNAERANSMFSRLVANGFRALKHDARAWYWVAPDTPGRRIFAGMVAQDERVKNPTSACHTGGMGLW